MVHHEQLCRHKKDAQINIESRDVEPTFETRLLRNITCPTNRLRGSRQSCVISPLVSLPHSLPHTLSDPSRSTTLPSLPTPRSLPSLSQPWVVPLPALPHDLQRPMSTATHTSPPRISTFTRTRRRLSFRRPPPSSTDPVRPIDAANRFSRDSLSLTHSLTPLTLQSATTLSQAPCTPTTAPSISTTPTPRVSRRRLTQYSRP